MKGLMTAWQPSGGNGRWVKWRGSILRENQHEGEQTVFHFHMHIVPRHKDDGAGLIWPRGARSSEELFQDAQRIRAGMSQ
jgi:histidine triad (HIT) family protein